MAEEFWLFRQLEIVNDNQLRVMIIKFLVKILDTLLITDKIKDTIRMKTLQSCLQLRA